MVDYDEHRRRMIAEVSEFINWGLAHPHEVRWIPRKRVGDGGFSHAMQRVFWGAVFGAGDVAPRQLLRRFLRWAGGE
jgi:hypothetical protein